MRVMTIFSLNMTYIGFHKGSALLFIYDGLIIVISESPIVYEKICNRRCMIVPIVPSRGSAGRRAKFS